MVSNGGAARRRVLLPAEADLCNALNLSEAEYWYFVELTDAYNGKRAEEYELAGVPGVENGPVAGIIVNLVIGIALSAIGALMAPKPKAPQQQQQQESAGTLTTADNIGSKRFTSTSNFDSGQDLASLGETIPLVFANRKDGIGGIRIKTLLLWSQILSYGTGQQLKALLMLSAGRLAEDPDFAGMAIGDQTLKNYTAAKVGLYRRLNGGRIQEGDRYSEGTLEPNGFGDVFTVRDDNTDTYQTWFCGNRSTSTNASFGLFSPVVNATVYRLPYELIMSQKDSDAKVKGDNAIKRSKISAGWRTLAGLEWNNGVLQYHIYSGSEAPDAYPPWGLSDVNNATEDRRTQADDSFQTGNLYMAGTAHVICMSSSIGDPWVPGIEKYYSFKVEQSGTIRTVDLLKDTREPYDYIIQRLAIGTVANTRACHQTEFGIKSDVWKQITGFPNVNSQPSNVTVADYENRNGNIQLGSIQRYVNRFSFFRFETRKLGVDGGWTDISGGHLFCVRGNAPAAQYSFIRVTQPYGQQEFRFVPVPGAEVVANWIGQDVYLLSPGSLVKYQAGIYAVAFSGYPTRMTSARLTNKEWKVGGVPSTPAPALDVFPRLAGPGRPTTLDWVKVEEKYSGAGGNVVGPPNAIFYLWSRSQPEGYWPGVGRFLGISNEFRPGRQVSCNKDRCIHWVERWAYINVESAPTGTVTVGTTAAQGSGMTLTVQRWANGHMEWSVAAPGNGYFDGDAISFTAFGQALTTRIVNDSGRVLENNLNVFDAVADIGRYDAERFSHDDNPEHQIVYINEVVKQDTAPQYDGLALLGLRLNATKEWSSFSQLSAYVKRGVVVERLIDDSGKPTAGLRAPTNNFAEIAYALLTDNEIGAGSILGASAVNRERMTIAAQFCRANRFTWDGVIAEKLNLRSWIFEQAAFCLLDFTILGGQFSLVPSVPYTADFKIDNEAKPAIKALFTDGNIRNLKVSWLSPEERQLFKAVCKWRFETENGFSQERTLVMRFADAQGGNDYDPEEAFDLSGFCTSQWQAEAFSQYALMLRKTVDHGIIFETTPQAAMGLTPGEYFRFVSEATHTSRFNNGSINSEGFITSTTALADGTYDVLVWMPGTVGVGEALLGVKDGKALQPELFGQVFTIKNSTTTSRVYRLESLSYSSEGFVEVAGSYAPLTSSGSLAALDWQPGAFLVDSF